MAYYIFPSNKYLQIATDHYRKAHNDEQSGAVEGVIALEASFFHEESSE